MDYSEKDIKKDNVKILIILALYVFILQFCISIDSYTHDLYDRSDTAWFFMCGKAWMNGMIPYVDFSDSKGPLLWLIYGIGYLISHHTYIGVFWLGCFFYTITFFYCYKIALLFLKDRKLALLSAFLMGFAYFNILFYRETRAEDFCQPFIAVGLYYTLKLWLLLEKADGALFKKASFFLGVGFSACLLIKFSIAAMFAIFIMIVCWIAIKEKVFKSFLLYLLLGCSAVCLPFVIYFICTGNWNDFLHEYFIGTYQTVALPFPELLKQYMAEVMKLFSINRRPVYLIYLLGTLAFSYYYRKLKLWPVLPALWFIAICLRHDNWGYYLNASSVFAIFGIILVVKLLAKKMVITKMKVKVAFWIVVISIVAIYRPFYRTNFFTAESSRIPYYEAADIMSQVTNPKIINIGHEIGVGMPVLSLPGYKYWAVQAGESEDIRQKRRLAIKEFKADFVTVDKSYDKQMKTQKWLDDLGYNYCLTLENAGALVALYARPRLLNFPVHKYRMTNKDIFFKRSLPFERTAAEKTKYQREK